jgi:hypothetical protein
MPDYVAEFSGAPFINFRQDYPEEELVRLIQRDYDFEPSRIFVVFRGKRKPFVRRVF